MKKIFILIFIHSFFFWTIACAGGQDTRNDFQKGLSLFQAGNYRLSYALFLKAFDEEPDNPELNFYLGRSAFEIKEYETAVMAYERILIVSPNENRVKLELARAFSGLGSNNSARRLCNEVLESNPPETVKKNIGLFMAAMDKSEKTHFLNGRFAFGVEWNTNVWASPTTGNINTVIGDVRLSGASSKKTQDWVGSTTANLAHTYKPRLSNLSWKTDATVYYAEYKDTSALDLQYLGLNSGPEWRTDKTRQSVKAVVKHIELGHVEYMSSSGVSAALEYAVRPTVKAGAGVQFERKDFKNNSSMDADNWALSGNLTVSSRSWQSGLDLRFEREKALDDEYSFKRIQASWSGSLKLPKDVIGTAGSRYRFSEYDENSSLFSKAREDHQVALYANIGKVVWQSEAFPGQLILLNLSYQHIWNFSNLDLYEFRQDLVQVSAAYQF